MKNILITILLLGNLYASTVSDELLKDMNKYFNIAKEYSVQGKNILIEQTLINGVNALVDNTKIKMNSFDINDTTNKIHINLFLEGEDQNLTINIDKFQWGVTEDKKHIIIEDFEINMDIPWIQYIVDDAAKRENGYLKIPNHVALFSLLYTIKPNIKTTYKEIEQKPFFITEYPFDERYLKIERLDISKNMIVTNIRLKGSKENLKIDVERYDIATKNGRKTIILKDMKYKEFTKPWIQSIIEAQDNEVHFKYTDKLFELLNR